VLFFIQVAAMMTVMVHCITSHIYFASDKYPLGNFNMSAGNHYQQENVSKTTDNEINIAITEKPHLY